MELKISQLIGYAFIAMIIAIGVLCVYLEYMEGMDNIDDNTVLVLTPTNSIEYQNGENITYLEISNFPASQKQKDLIINNKVYRYGYEWMDYVVFKDYKIIIIPNDKHPKVYFKTITDELCNTAVLIGDQNCYNSSYLKIYLFVDSDTASSLSNSYYSMPDLSDYEIIYSEELYR